MPTPRKKQIVQLVAPATPVFAVFNNIHPKKAETESDLWLVPCPVLALVDDEEFGQEVRGFIVEETGIQDPDSDSFLGYADDAKSARNQYIPIDPLPTE